MTGLVIELDREHAEVPLEGPGMPLRWRPLAVAVAVLLSGTVLVAAAPLPGSRLIELAGVDPASVVTMRLTGSTLVAVMRDGGPHLVGYQLADGARQWSAPLPLDSVDVQVGGQLEIVDGVVLLSVGDVSAATRTVAMDATAVLQRGLGELPTWLTLGVYGDQLVLVTVRRGRPILAAYKLSTLDLRWTSPLSALDIKVTRCGPWLCASDGHSIDAIAVDTGAPAWQLTDAGHFKGWADGWMYDEPYPAEPDDAILVDPVTQRVMLQLGRWRIPEPSSAGPVLMMLTERHSTRTWLGLLTTGPGIDILGAVPDLTLNSCDVAVGYLACLTTTGQLRIWRYRR